MIRLLIAGIFLLLPACGASESKISDEITRQFQSSGRTFVNLAEVVSSDWDRVCILGPYSTMKHAYDTLGFAWPLDTQSSISSDDSLALLLFVKNKAVVETVEHPRRNGDFTNLSRQCFNRKKAIFQHQTNPKKGWPGLFPKT